MKYFPPVNGDQEDPNRPYNNASPLAGIEGSWPHAKAIEGSMREILAVIAAAGLEEDPADFTQLLQAIQSLAGNEKRIGEPFAVWDHLIGADVPTNANPEKYIKLTAGLTGAGQFNLGLLMDESVSGTAPLVNATAKIAVGPLAGQTIHLLNTERAFIRPDTTSGTLAMDSFQGHHHTARAQSLGGAGSTSFGRQNGPETPDNMVNGAITDGVNGTPRIANETRPKNVSATIYMRIV